MNFPQSLLLLADDAGVAEAALTEAPVVPEGPNMWLVLLIFLCVVMLPFVVGNVLGRWLRVKEHSLKIGITLFSLVLAVSPFVAARINGQSIEDCFRLGIDLAGGTNMVFQIDHERAEQMEKDITPRLMDNMVSSIRERVNASGVEEIVVRQVGEDSFEVIVPGTDEAYVEQVINRIVDLGSLEISILANRVQHSQLCDLGQQAADAGVKEVRLGGQLVAQWFPVAPNPTSGEPKNIGTGHSVQIHEFEYQDNEAWPHYLVVVETDPEQAITGGLLDYAREEIQDGRPVVGFHFNIQGGYRFHNLTARNRPRQASGHHSRLAIVLSGEIHSAPDVTTPITGGDGIIYGDFTIAEVQELTSILNAGALEVPLVREPVSQYTISPMLGADVREKGMNAILWSGVAVCLFMLVYYLFAGGVACICVACNLLMIMGSMALIDATFTLPGLAGIVLTIGMAVDANVLIYERMREEILKGSSIRMAIQNGFSKALSSIVDSNLTTMITGVVLYVIGTEQVKGFAVTLCIGIVMTMFTVLYIGRLIFDICERNRWIKSLHMLGPRKPFNFRFYAMTWPAVSVSAILIVAGMIAMFVRGEENFDIDFRGGTMVTFSFDGEPPPYEEVQERLLKQFEPGATVEELELQEGPEATGTSKHFRLRTTNDVFEEVSQRIITAFDGSGHNLLRQDIEYASDITAIPAAVDGDDNFAGGHRRELTLTTPIAAATLRGTLADMLESFTVEESDDAADTPPGTVKYPEAASLVEVVIEDESVEKHGEFEVRLAPEITLADAEVLFATLATDLEKDPIYEEATQFKASVAQDMMFAALAAILVSFVAVIAYLWFRFQSYTFGVAAVVAILHDVLVVLGMMALCSLISGNSIADMLLIEDFKINLPIVAAILTLMGYSLNDTIVTFDRIREIRGRSPRLTVEMVDASVNQTLSRTILTALTVFVVVLILYIWGGEGIHGFAFSLVIGVIAGSYSSIYMAAPVLMWLINREYARSTASQRRPAPAS